MESRDFYIGLRRRLLEIISGVEDARYGLPFDDTTPNSAIRSRLHDTYTDCLSKVSAFGVFVVTRHSDCSHPDHEIITESTFGYAISNEYDLDISYKDERFVWYNQLSQGDRNCVCPCSTRNTATRHWVIDEVVFDPMARQEECERLSAILSDLHSAIEKAGDNRPRAAIREHLLRAVLHINDGILPSSVDAFIVKELKELR